MEDKKEVWLAELSTDASDPELDSIRIADEQLTLLGHKAELKRTHTFWTLFGLQTTISTNWTCNIVLYSYIYTIGGAMSSIWTTLIVGIGQTLLMMSIAEYAGIWPQAGGQQFFTQMVAPQKMKRFLSYVVGWCVLIGEISTSSSCALNSAQIVAAFIGITHPDVTWRPWMTFLIYNVFLIGPVVTNLIPRGIPQLSLAGGVFNCVGFIVWIFVFLVMAPKNSAEFVFTKFINDTGYPSNTWVFILSMYVPMYGLYGTDSVLHLAEEMKHPSRDAPRVIIWSMIFSTFTAFISVVIMGFTTGNWKAEINADQPYLNWYMNVTESVYGGGIWCAITMLGLNYLIIVFTNTAGSRIAWRMAKDGGFPFADFHSQISQRFGTPLRAMSTLLFINALAGTLVLGSELAFWALISAGSITLQLSFLTPILCVVCRGRKILPPRPYFDLGRWGYTVNIISLAWTALTLLFFSFPQYLPIVGHVENMNWAVPMLAVCVIFCAVYWAISGRHKYMKTSNTVFEENVAAVERSLQIAQ